MYHVSLGIHHLSGYLLLVVYTLLPFSRSAMSDSVAPWTAGRQASLSLTIFCSLLRLVSVEWVMPSNANISFMYLLLIYLLCLSVYFLP